MTKSMRVWTVAALLVAAAWVSSSQLRSDARTNLPLFPTAAGQRAVQPADLGQDGPLPPSKFDQGGILSYQTVKGERLFAWQFKPALGAPVQRPRDYLIMVSTTATQAGPNFVAGQQLIAALTKSAGANDRVSLWMVSSPEERFTRNLTKGFIDPKKDEKQVKNALDVLANQFPAGTSDLQATLTKAIDSFEPNDQRQLVILYLGDGQSNFAPLKDAGRTALAQKMVERRIGFFPVPLGRQLDAANLHGLATGTGGAVIRVKLLQDKTPDVVTRIVNTVAEPIFYPTKLQMTADVTEFFPTRLPPLRSDAPTLVLGKMKETKELSATVEGYIDGQAAKVSRKVTDKVSEPELDNYFLLSMFEQWGKAKDQPALIRADRALIFAFETNRLALDELLEGAGLAMQKANLEAAARLYLQAQQLAPHDPTAQAGMKLVEGVKLGKINIKKFLEQIDNLNRKVVKIGKNNGGAKFVVDQFNKLVQPDMEKKGPGGADFAGDDIKAQRDLILLQEQQLAQTVDLDIKLARDELRNDPEGARERLRKALLGVKDHPAISDVVRNNLLKKLEVSLRDVSAKGDQYKLLREQQQQIQAQILASKDKAMMARVEEENFEKSFRLYRNLMNEARYDILKRQALTDQIMKSMMQMQEAALAKGKAAPTSAQASYAQTLAAYNLQVQNDLRPERERQFLAIMMEVEKSHIPLPDEPPIHFMTRLPASQQVKAWKILSQRRKEMYENSDFLDDPAGRKDADRIANQLETMIDMSDLQQPMKLYEAIELIILGIEKVSNDKKELPVIIDTEAFKAAVPDAQDPQETQVKFPKQPKKMSAKMAIKLALSQIPAPQATYVIRRDFVEITTVDRALADKVLRVYPVGDLVLPVSSSKNPYAMGGFGGMGMGGGFGMMGMGGMGMMPGMGMGMGMMPGMGMGMGMGGGMGGMIPGQNCLGFNQFNGGLGAFGTGGLDQGLILLIKSVVAPGTWDIQQCQLTAPVGGPWGGMGPGMVPGMGPGMGPGVPGLPGFPGAPGAPTADPAEQAKVNHIAFYPAALALVVQAPATKHYKHGGGIFGGGKKPAAAAMDFQQMKDKPGVLVLGPGGKPGPEVAGGKDRVKLDPAKIWQDALARGLENPGLIVAAADLLFEMEKYDHAVEFLKANLRQGIIVEPWVYEALAIAMKFEGADPEEIRRVSLSAISLNPKDARSYIKAAQAYGQHALYGKALAFCEQAAALEPGLSSAYAEALVFAAQAKDAKSMAWAASNLRRQDWGDDTETLNLKADKNVANLIATLKKENRTAEADKLQAAVKTLQQRDLTIVLTWEPGSSGDADLELEVKEPTGTVCSSQHRHSPGGGVLSGLNLGSTRKGTYTASQAFSGEYQITIKRLWGQPAAGKFRLEIIYHQGTPQEKHRIETIVLDKQHTLKFTLESGRRTDLAQVAPTVASPAPQPKDEVAKGSNIMIKLRDMADSVHSQQLPRGMKLAGSKSSTPPAPVLPKNNKQPEHMVFQSGTGSNTGGGVFLTTQAHVSADGQVMRLSINPVFQPAAMGKGRPQLDVPLIPGGGN